MLVDESDTLLAGLWGDKHDDTQVVLVGYGFYDVLIVLEGQVGDDGTADATLHTTLAKGFDAIVEDGVEIAHEHERNLYLVLDVFQLAEEFLQTHPVLEGLCRSTLDDGTVGQWITEGNAYFDHVDSPALHGLDDLACIVKCRTSCTEVERQELASLVVFEKLVDLIHT